MSLAGVAEVGVISKHSAAIDHAGEVGSTDSTKPWNVPVRPPFGAYIVESAGPMFERLPLFSCVTLVRFVNGVSVSFVNCKPDPSRLWWQDVTMARRSFVNIEPLGPVRRR